MSVVRSSRNVIVLYKMLLYLIFTLSTLTSCVLCELLHKYEGDKCQWGEATGTCVHVYKCPRAPLYLKERTQLPICSFKGKEPIVCCTDCDLVEDNRKIIINPDLGLLHLTGQKSHNECVKFIDKLDYGCKERTSSDIDVRTLDPVNNCQPTSPKTRRDSSDNNNFLAILGYGADIDQAEWKCSGAIISEKFILTSAYCLDLNDIGPVNFVALNIKSDLIAPWDKYKVKRSIPHPEYKPGSKYHDIALIETQDNINFSRDVLPACLHSNTDIDIDLGYSMIWDTKEEDNTVPLKITNTKGDTIKCMYFHPPVENVTDGFNETMQSCYGNIAPPQDSCVTDLGSPLLSFFNLVEDCADIVLGVTSIERTCGTLVSSGLYTKVIYYVPWIESIVWP